MPFFHFQAQLGQNGHESEGRKEGSLGGQYQKSRVGKGKPRQTLGGGSSVRAVVPQG